MKNSLGFINDLKSIKRPLLADGAMGTVLHQKGIETEVFENLNRIMPDMVSAVHQDYIKAGAEIIQTNTFGANSFKLEQVGLGYSVNEINQLGVKILRDAIKESGRKIYLAGDIGPLGIRMAPFGKVQKRDVYQAYSEQVEALVSAGVDLIILETMTDLMEVLEAVKAIQTIAPGLPIISSMSFTRDDRTIFGDQPDSVARKLSDAGVDIIGANCSGGPNQLLRIHGKMRAAVPQGLFSIMPNAGWPEQVGGRIMYSATPHYFGENVSSFWEAGVNVLGGCCGTSPAHILAMRAAIDELLDDPPAVQSPQSLTKKSTHLQAKPTDLNNALKKNNFIITVEMSPPKGVAVHKMLAGASQLADAGADFINLADSPMARMRMSPWAACNLIQKEIGIETILHFPTRGRNLLRVQGDLLAAHTLGIRNIFIVMGDPTSIGEYPDAMDNFDLAPSGLIKLVKHGFNSGQDHSGGDIGEPTSFFVGTALNVNPPLQKLEREIRILNRKINAGADFILTQPVYDPNLLGKFKQAYETVHGPIPVPILAGILPLASERHAAFLQQEVPGIDIPESIHQKIGLSEKNAAETGIEIAINLIEELKKVVNGVYLMPAFGRYDHAADIIETITHQ